MARVDIPDRICPHCGGTRWIIEKEKKRYWIRTRYRCAKKAYERSKKWCLANPDKVKEYQKNRQKTYWKTPKMREYERLRSARHSSELTDKYIRYMLRHNPVYRNATITPEMIERYRIHLKTSRQLKTIENAKKRNKTEVDRRSSLSNGRKSKKRI